MTAIITKEHVDEGNLQIEKACQKRVVLLKIPDWVFVPEISVHVASFVRKKTLRVAYCRSEICFR